MQFSTDWVTHQIPNFQTCIDAIEGAKETFLEIGSFEGRSACWLLQNGLDADGTLFCIDPFYGVKGFNNQSLREIFDSNIKEAKGKDQEVLVTQAISYKGLPELIDVGASFSFIYVDGSHNARDTLTDLCMTWPLLTKGGVMLIDDYEWHWAEGEQEKPKLAIDCFLKVFEGKYELLFKNYQVGIKKL